MYAFLAYAAASFSLAAASFARFASTLRKISAPRL